MRLTLVLIITSLFLLPSGALGFRYQIQEHIDQTIDSGYVLSNNCELVYAHSPEMCYTYFKTVYDDIKVLDRFDRKVNNLGYVHFYEDHEDFLVLELRYGQTDESPYLILLDKYTGKIAVEGATDHDIVTYKGDKKAQTRNIVTSDEEEAVYTPFQQIAARIQHNMWFYLLGSLLLISLIFYMILTKKKNE